MSDRKRWDKTQRGGKGEAQHQKRVGKQAHTNEI